MNTDLSYYEDEAARFEYYVLEMQLEEEEEEDDIGDIAV
jgi:hypothetical protein